MGDRIAALEAKIADLERLARKLEARPQAGSPRGLQYRIERVELTEDLGTGGTAEAEIQPSGKTITVTDLDGWTFSSGDSLWVFYYHPPGETTGKWHPVNC